MKGLNLAEDIGWTLILFLVFMALAIIALMLFIQLTVSNFLGSSDPVAYSIEFVQIYSKPFMLTEVLVHAKFGDRQLLEQAIEITAANSLDGADVTNLPSDLDGFLRAYEFRDYYVSINDGNGNEIVNVQKADMKCGDNFEGFCVVSKLFSPNPFSDTCDVGRVEIPDNGACSLFQKCCKWDPQAYAAQNKYVVVSCGGQGVCSEGRKIIQFIPTIPPTPYFIGPFCDRGEIDLGNQPVCKDENSGDTQLCCAPQTEDLLVATGLATKAFVPLLYKNLVYGTLEVTAR